MRIFTTGLALSLCMNSAAYAFETELYSAFLVDGNGDRIHVANLQTDAARYSIEMTEAPFSDFFLSMRPFKCIDGPDKLWCYVPYPYEINRDISGSLTDLEYDFLFVWKNAGDYGIDLWNGVYYVISETPEGYVGQMHDLDMNELAAPPEQGNLRPIGAKHLEPAEPDSHWLPLLVIEPKD